MEALKMWLFNQRAKIATRDAHLIEFLEGKAMGGEEVKTGTTVEYKKRYGPVLIDYRIHDSGEESYVALRVFGKDLAVWWSGYFMYTVWYFGREFVCDSDLGPC